VANLRSNSLSTFSFDDVTGALAPIATVSTGGGPYSLAAHPSGRLLYAASQSSNEVSRYSIDPATGGLTSLGRATDGHGRIVLHPSGRFAYLVSSAGYEIRMFEISGDQGAWSPLGSLAFGAPSPPWTAPSRRPAGTTSASIERKPVPSSRRVASKRWSW
jgi:6-phosphogluconolactonase (cycloisomerase 2 family)